MQPHIETIQHNKYALILQEIQNEEQKDQISSMQSKINNLYKKTRRARAVFRKNQLQVQQCQSTHEW